MTHDKSSASHLRSPLRSNSAPTRPYSLEEYDAQHRHPLNRAAHAIGIPLVALSVVGLISPWRPFGWSRRAALGGLAAGGALLWAGHAIEGNRPAVLTNPAAAVAALRWWSSRAIRSRRSAIPRDPHLDSTVAFLREGYRFIGNRCRQHNSDLFETRLLFRKVVCMRGEDAARVFYAPERFTRRRAVPVTTLMLLQDFGSVQTLDGDAHRHRKHMFMSLLTGTTVHQLVQATMAEWRAHITWWERTRGNIILHDEVRKILCRAVCTWAGVPLAEHEVVQRAKEFGAMIDGSGAVGPQNWRALALRHRTERWIQNVIEGIRSARLRPPEASAAHVIAWHRDPDGRLLTTRTAAVELINILRPTVAVSQFITFGALALHDHPEWRRRLQDDPGTLEHFVQEVRRFYPFFPAIGGRVLNEFDWRGHHFSKGDRVLLDVYGTNHDPHIWGDPESFRPQRFETWDGGPFSFIPQGGGTHDDGHRCPGEAITIALTKAAVRLLTTSMRYDVPPQDLHIRMTTMPALPASRFVMTNVRRT